MLKNGFGIRSASKLALGFQALFQFAKANPDGFAGRTAAWLSCAVRTLFCCCGYTSSPSFFRIACRNKPIQDGFLEGLLPSKAASLTFPLCQNKMQTSISFAFCDLKTQKPVTKRKDEIIYSSYNKNRMKSAALLRYGY